MTYSIGQISQNMNIVPSTLRYYESEGLLPSVTRTKGGIRMYGENDLERLRVIECLKKSGLSIRDIRQFMDWCEEGDSTIEKRLELIKRRQEAVQAQIEQLKTTLGFLDYKRWYYETARQAGTCGIFETLEEGAVPERFRKK